MKYRFLPHTADIMVRAEGRTKEEAFLNAALALKESICGEIAVAPRLGRRIEVKGADSEALLCSFLEEFLFLLDAEGFLPAGIKSVVINGDTLIAEVSGDDASRYKFSNSVKAVTYNEMFVREQEGGWAAQFVLDV